MASPQLIPVDNDPFATASNDAQLKLVPVDHDPFQQTSSVAPLAPEGLSAGRNVVTAPVTSMGRFHTVSDDTDLPAYERFLKGAKDPIDAAAQLLTKALPTGAVNAVNSATAAVNNTPVIGPITKALGMTPASNEQINQDITKSNQDYDTRRKAAGGQGFDAYRLLGNIAAQAPLAYLAPNPASLGGAIASGAATGAAGGALTPVNNAGKDYWTQKLEQLGIGALTGAATTAGGKIIQKVLQPNVNPDVQLLMSKGVTPTPGQLLGRTAAATEDKLTSIPGFGDAIKAGQRRAIDQLNVAAYNEALAPIGQKVTGQQIGREGVESVQQKISDAYSNVLPKLTFQVDGQLGQDINRIAASAQNLPPEQAAQFSTILSNKIGSQISPNGTMSGETFKTVESELTRLKSRLGADPSAFNKELGDHVGMIQSALRDSLERTNPQFAPELQNINLAYANFARVRDAASRVGNENGVFTPAQLQSAVRAGDKSAGKGKFATGNALMQDLSEAGKNVLGSKYPNSGTPGRMLATLMAGGGLGYLNPGALGAGLLASSAYTPAIQKGLGLLIAGQRPQAVRALSAGIGKAVPALSQSAILGLLSHAAGG